MKNNIFKFTILSIVFFYNTTKFAQFELHDNSLVLKEIKICLIPLSLKLKTEPTIDKVLDDDGAFCERSKYYLCVKEFLGEIETRDDVLSFNNDSLIDKEQKHHIRASVKIQYYNSEIEDIMLIDSQEMIYFQEKWHCNTSLVSFLLQSFSKNAVGRN